MEKGQLSVKYLGVPLASRKLTIQQYSPLMEKMTSRITAYSARMLSYAERVQLIKSALFSVHLYWSQIFLIPVAVMDELEVVCRAFFWSGVA